MAAAQLLAQLDARHAGHLDVGHDHIDVVVAHPFETLSRRRDRMRGDPAALQSLVEESPGVFIIIDE